MVRSGLTISNQDRLRRYNEERRQEERNDVVQQAELYGYLAEENKLDAQATSLARLAKNVFKKSFDIPKAIEPAIIKEIAKTKITLLDAIKQGKLDELVKSIIAIPENQLNARQRIIQKDLGNKEFKQSINDAIAEAVSAGKNIVEIKEIVTELLAGSEGKADLEGMTAQAQEGSLGEVKPSATEEPSVREAPAIGLAGVILNPGFTIKIADEEKKITTSFEDINKKVAKIKGTGQTEQLLELIKENNLTIESTGKPQYKQLLAVFETALLEKNIIKNETIPKDYFKTYRSNKQKYQNFIL